MYSFSLYSSCFYRSTKYSKIDKFVIADLGRAKIVQLPILANLSAKFLAKSWRISGKIPGEIPGKIPGKIDAILR